MHSRQNAEFFFFDKVADNLSTRLCPACWKGRCLQKKYPLWKRRLARVFAEYRSGCTSDAPEMLFLWQSPLEVLVAIVAVISEVNKQKPRESWPQSWKRGCFPMAANSFQFADACQTWSLSLTLVPSLNFLLVMAVLLYNSIFFGRCSRPINPGQIIRMILQGISVNVGR